MLFAAVSREFRWSPNLSAPKEGRGGEKTRLDFAEHNVKCLLNVHH